MAYVLRVPCLAVVDQAAKEEYPSRTDFQRDIGLSRGGRAGSPAGKPARGGPVRSDWVALAPHQNL